MRRISLFFLVFLTTHSSTFAANQESSATATGKKSMVMLYTGSKDDLFGRWLNLVYAEAFGRMGMELLMKTCPPKRCSHWSDTGRADGELARVFSYNQTNPRMIRVDEPLVAILWSAYSKNPSIKLNGWDSFRGTDYRVDYRLGLVEAELALNRIVRKDRLSTVKSVVQGLRKLSHGRSDVYVDVENTVLQHLKDDEFRKSGIMKAGVMEETSLHAFFHERNRFYAGRLSDVLKDMKNEGLFLEYIDMVRNEHAIPGDE